MKKKSSKAKPSSRKKTGTLGVVLVKLRLANEIINQRNLDIAKHVAALEEITEHAREERRQFDKQLEGWRGVANREHEVGMILSKKLTRMAAFSEQQDLNIKILLEKIAELEYRQEALA
jgi:hypothetical protein